MSGMSGLAVREMRWTDLQEVAMLERVLYPESAWSAATWWAELAQRPARRYVVLESEVAGGSGPIAGYAGLTMTGRSADVMTIAVDQALRGQGWGSVLLSTLHAQAARAGAEEVMLEVRADNRAALALYAAHGYRTVSVRRGYYQPGAVDAIVQRHELSGGDGPPDDRRDSEGG